MTWNCDQRTRWNVGTLWGKSARVLPIFRQLKITVLLLTWEAVLFSDEAVFFNNFSLILKRFLKNRRQLLKIRLWESDLVGLCCNGKGSTDNSSERQEFQ